MLGQGKAGGGTCLLERQVIPHSSKNLSDPLKGWMKLRLRQWWVDSEWDHTLARTAYKCFSLALYLNLSLTLGPLRVWTCGVLDPFVFFPSVGTLSKIPFLLSSIKKIKKWTYTIYELCLVAHAWNLNTLETGTGKLLWTRVQSGLHSECLV